LEACCSRCHRRAGNTVTQPDALRNKRAKH
jgi:hypothetical protein